jgi:hypothetical protein
MDDEKMTGEYASLNEMAGQSAPAEDTRSVTEALRLAVVDYADLAVGDAQIVGKAVMLLPGSALTFTVLDVDGVEYDAFVRPRP